MRDRTGCGTVEISAIGTCVHLAGWVHRRRDHGGIIFIDLRDGSGLVQIVVNPETVPDIHKIAQDVRPEWVLQIDGIVEARPEGTENSQMKTGTVEVIASKLKVINPSKTPPFYINEEQEVDESLRLTYRYLDLRRSKMRDNIVLRHKVVKFIRDFLDRENFIEIETPILIKSTPEGARDYLVPSRLKPGAFYALPQSPQQLKQLLMVAGFERYFQIARCFRDEDARSDRQPEFTQLDLEMSFVDQEEILSLIEQLYIQMVTSVAPGKVMTTPFPRLDYDEAMDRFGTDKPDLRFALELRDISDVGKTTQFRVFTSAVEAGGIIKGFSSPRCANYSRRQQDELVQFAKSNGASGLITIAISDQAPDINSLTMDQIRSPASRFLTLDEIKTIATRLAASPGDMLLIVAGPKQDVVNSLGQLRNLMGDRLEMADPNALAFAFVVNFPLFNWDSVQKKWDSSHHPFTMPKEEQLDLLEMEDRLAEIKSNAYDLVCNGNELASGSIRIHKSKIQEKIFEILGYSSIEIEERFGHLLRAFEFGAPPHGGIAPGIDRFVAILAGASSIRDVIAFPKVQSGADLLFGAPDFVSREQLTELGLKLADV
ncbi:aspartate--tRNA ligase [SAR202 cluster bacterium AD-804-J14_MRT_500m]|nr:aspartate--tRNA ligase [SAR202 cluster bacterium AD-804-J14_MRT_500m]